MAGHRLGALKGGGGALFGGQEVWSPNVCVRRRLDGRLEEVAEAVWGDYCRLQMPRSLALAVGKTVAGQRLGGLEGAGGGGYLPPFQCIVGGGGGEVCPSPVFMCPESVPLL